MYMYDVDCTLTMIQLMTMLYDCKLSRYQYIISKSMNCLQSYVFIFKLTVVHVWSTDSLWRFQNGFVPINIDTSKNRWDFITSFSSKIHVHTVYMYENIIATACVFLNHLLRKTSQQQWLSLYDCAMSVRGQALLMMDKLVLTQCWLASFTHEFTLVANLIVQRVSPAEDIAGLTFANIRVFASPPREFWRR